MSGTSKSTIQRSLLSRKLHRLEPESVIFHTLNYIFLILLCLIMIYPMIYTLAVSFSSSAEVTRGNVKFWPSEFTTYNYKVVFNMNTIYIGLRNTTVRTIVNVVTNIALTSMLAYALSRPEFVFRKFITLVYVLTMYFDPGLIPNFLLIQTLGLTNSFHVYWIPGMVAAFNLIIIRTYIKGIPESLIESARLDGAGEFRIYAQIIMPLCLPVLATIALFVAVGNWNAWFDNFLYNGSSPNLSLLQYELQKLLQSAMQSGQQASGQATAAAQAQLGMQQVTPAVIRATITIVSAIPILVVYPFLQKYFVAGVKLGGVKE